MYSIGQAIKVSIGRHPLRCNIEHMINLTSDPMHVYMGQVQNDPRPRDHCHIGV